MFNRLFAEAISKVVRIVLHSYKNIMNHETFDINEDKTYGKKILHIKDPPIDMPA